MSEAVDDKDNITTTTTKQEVVSQPPSNPNNDNPEEESGQVAAAQQQEEEVKILPLEDQKKLFSRVKDSMLRSSTSVEAIQEACGFINILSAKALTGGSPLSEEQTKFFYGEFFKEICQRAVNAETTHGATQEAIADMLRALVDLLASELKAQTPTCLDLVEKMRHVFDPSKYFHKNAFQSAYTNATSTGQAMSSVGDTDQAQVEYTEDDLKWRKALDVGKTVDAIKMCTKFHIQGWAKGEISAINGSVSNIATRTLTIKWEKDVSAIEAVYSALDSSIAPYGTKTHDQGWRDTLQKGDVVDALDKFANWSKATIMCLDPRKHEDASMPMIKMGFREYSELGDKSDRDGKYFGFSENLDEFIGQYSLRIQKPNSQTTLKDLAGNSVKMDEAGMAKLKARGYAGGTTIVSEAERRAKQDEKDMELIEQEGQVIVAVERDICKSKFLVELLVRFADAQGFESILGVLAKAETSLQSVKDLLTLVCGAGGAQLYHKSFVEAYFQRIKDVAEAKLLSADEKLLRATQFTTFEESVDMVWLTLMKRCMSERDIQVGKYQLLTKLGILFFKQNFMQKRIDGAIAINQVCNKALAMGALPTTEIKNDKDDVGVLPSLLQTLKEADIIDLYFERTKIHNQLVQRAEGVIGLFLCQDALTDDDLNMIWRNCLAEDAIYRNLIGCLSNLDSSAMKPAQSMRLIERVMQTGKSKIRNDEIELLQTLCFNNITSVKTEDEPLVKLNQAAVLEFYWDYLTCDESDKYLNKVIANKAIFNFMDLLKAATDEQIASYFEKVASALKSNQASFIPLKIAHRFFKEQKVTNKAALPLLADKLEEQFDFMQRLIEEMQAYSAMVNAKVAEEIKEAELQEAKAPDESKLHEQTFSGCFDHQQQISERIEFLTLFSQECARKLSKEHLAKLWTSLVENNKVKFDKKQLFSMLKDFISVAISNEENNVISLEDLCSFYRDNIANGLSDFTTLEMEGYVCIQGFFVLINSGEGRLKLLDDSSASNKPKSILKSGAASTANKVTSISSNQGSKKQNLDFGSTHQIDTTGTQTGQVYGPQPPPSKTAATNTTQNKLPESSSLRLVSRVTPSEMEGLAGLWQIAKQAELSKVNEAVVSLLIQIHTQLDEPLKGRLPEFEDLYMSSCVQSIHEQQRHIKERSEEQKVAASTCVTMVEKKVHLVEEKRISNALKCLTRLIQNSEREGTFGLTSHRSFAEGTLVNNIAIQNSFNYSTNSGYQQSFTLNIKSNISIYQLKKIICKELAFKKSENIQEVPLHPSSIKLVVNRYLDRPIQDFENGLLLQELFLKSGDKFTVLPRGNDDILTVALIDAESNQLTQRAMDAVKQLFDKFAVQSEQVPELRYLGTEQVKQLKEEVGSKAEYKPNSILAYNTTEDVEKLLYQDFLAFYTAMALEKPEMVRDNLSYIGLRADMRKVPKAGDSEHSLVAHKVPQDMPRFKLSNKQETFQTLLSCLNLHQDTRRDANELILQACTNKRILEDVLQVRSSQFNWDSMQSEEHSLEVVYTLSMVEQILYNSSEADANSDLLSDASVKAQTELKNTWVPRFLKAGGLDKLTQMMDKVLKALLLGRKEGTMKDSVILKYKEILSVTMKIVKVFVTATVCSLQNDTNADLFSIKQTSSALSKRLLQGPITSIITNKYLRRADKEEEDLEDKLEKSCVNRSSAVNFFGVPIKLNNNVGKTTSAAKPTSSATAPSQSTTAALKTDFQPEDITEDFLFSNDTPQQKVQADDADQVLEQPELTKKISHETKATDRERIHLIDVTPRYRQIAGQIAEALSDPAFELNLDFDLIEDFCLEAACTFMFSADKELTFERTLIKEAFDVWVACAVKSGKPLAWKRKPENITEKTRIKCMEDLIKEGISCSMPEVRRFWFQTISLACEQLSKGGQGREPYTIVISVLLEYLNTIDYTLRIKLSEELYELLGDSCLFLYYTERDMKQSGIEFEPIGHDIYKSVMTCLINALKEHNSFNEENEVLTRAKALESLLLALADVFSFYNKGASYDDVATLIKEEGIVEQLFYEVLFFVPGKTQCAQRNKAKRSETRKAAYQLLYKVLKFLKPEDMTAFMNDLLTPMVQSVPRPISWSHTPSDKVRRPTEQSGIRNLGNVCYMISMLQQFFMVPSFRFGLLKVKDETAENIVEHKERKFDDNLLRQLQNLFGFLELTERAFVDPTEFCYSFKQWDGKPTNTGEQRDAQEFLNEFFDKLENQLKPTSQRYLLADTFQGSIVSQRTCESCGDVTSSVDPFYTQTLFVKDRHDVYESLAKQVEGEVIQDFRCGACKELVNLRSTKLLGKLPNVLIFHLQRIDFDFDTYQNKKLNDRYEFPNILELKDYSYKNNVTLSEEEKELPKNQDFKELLDYDDDEFVYRLVGVNIHRGAAGAGHYWSLIHTNRGEKEPNPQTEESKWMDLSKDWREFNDESVSFFFSKNIAEHGYGGYLNDAEMRIYTSGAPGDFGKSAYMLVYEKKLKSELRQINPSEDGKEEVETKVAFNSVEKEVPDWIKDAVTKDNRACVSDSQIFHPLFFNFTTTLLKHCTANLLDQEDDCSPSQKPVFSQLQRNIYEQSQRLTFDLLTHFKDIETTKQVSSSLRSLFSWSDPVTEFGLKEESLLLTFIRDVLHKDKCEYLFKIMHDSHTSRDVRDQIGRTVTRAIIKGIKIISHCKSDPERKELPQVVELETLVREVTGFLFDVLKSRKFQAKWSYLREYFEMLSDIGIDERYQAEFLLSQYDDIVADLCDFMLQQNSPRALKEEDARVEMGGSTNKPSFGPLVALASHLLRCQWTKSTTDESPTFTKKFNKNKDAKQEPLVDERIDLKVEAAEFFTNSHLFEMVMSQSYDVLNYSKGLAHLCWGNKALSKKVCKMAIKCRNEGSHPNYMVVLRQMLRLQDRDQETGELLQLRRLEWVFGSPQPRFSTVDTAADSAEVKLGLESLAFNIHADAYSYVTALQGREDDQVSLLKILIKQYKADQMAIDVDSAPPTAPQQPATATATDNNATDQEDSPCKFDLKPVEINADLQRSSVEEQLRAQGMPEDMVKHMASAAGEVSSTRPKSADAVTSATADLKVDKYLNLEALVYFLRIVTSDETCMDFFAKMPGFTYQYARYTDWIGQYILSLSKLDEVDAKALIKDQKQDLKALQTSYAQFESYLTAPKQPLAKKPSAEAEDVEMIDTSNVSAAAANQEEVALPPLPYMILKAESSGGLDAGVTVESGNGLTLRADILKCTYVPSMPTNSTNLAVSKSFLAKFGPQREVPSKTAPAAVVAESNSKDAETQQDDAKPASDGDKDMAQAASSQFKEPATQDELEIKLEDPAVQYALSKMITDPEFMWIFEFPEDEKLQCLENMVKDSVFKFVQEYYKNNSGASQAAENKQEAAEQQPVQAEAADPVVVDREEGSDPFAEWDGSETQTCDDLVYVLRLSNMSEEAMKFKISLQAGSFATSSQLVWPLNGLVGTIAANQSDKIVAMLPKLEAIAMEEGSNQLQKLHVELTCVIDKKNQGMPGDQAANRGNEGTNVSRHDKPVGGAEQFVDIPGEKQCEACTSFNSIDATVCSVCLTKFQN